MSQMNVDPLTTFADGSQLFVSTLYDGEGRFSCGLYVFRPGEKNGQDLRAVADLIDAPTCCQAQELAYRHARRRYPESAQGMKEPPYLIWSGPNLPGAPDYRGRRLHRRQGGIRR